MKHRYPFRRSHFPSKAWTVPTFLVLLVLLGALLIRQDLVGMNGSFTRNLVTSAITSLFTRESSTLTYLTNEDKGSLTEAAIKHSFYSSALLYVQASAGIADSSLTDDSVFIHTKKEEPIGSPTPSIPSVPLDASRESDFATNASPDSYDNVYFEDEYDVSSALAPAEIQESTKQALASNKSKISSLVTSLDRSYLLKQFYTINSSCVIDNTVWNVKQLLTKDLTIKKDSSEPQILILHTHAHETFADSRPGVKSDSITGVGDALASILKDKYGFNVLHSTKQYEYNSSYNEALVDLNKFLKEYPSIKIVLDLHRDGVSESCSTHTVVDVNGKQMAPIMFFNGVSNNKKPSLNFHTNKNLQANLAFSLQMKLYAMQAYPQFTKKNFLKSFRYNMHVVERYSLVEVGDNNNTVAEAKAAMAPLADLINHVLTSRPNY